MHALVFLFAITKILTVEIINLGQVFFVECLSQQCLVLAVDIHLPLHTFGCQRETIGSKNSHEFRSLLEKYLFVQFWEVDKEGVIDVSSLNGVDRDALENFGGGLAA